MPSVQTVAARSLVCAAAMAVHSEAFVLRPSLLPAMATRGIETRAALCRPRAERATTLSMSSTTSSASSPAASGGSEISYGPHLKIGKKGNILNPWGFWVMTYSMVFAITGWLYLKLRQVLSVLLLGFLKPTPEHCCWIMHSWCNLVLKLGFSAPEVAGLENLPPEDETVLVCANHMSWFDVPALHGYLGGRLLWSFAKAELVKVPVLGTYMQSAEHILISRQSKKSQLESLKSAIKTLGMKRNVFIFPEGTRSLDGKLRDFKGGAFTIARKSGCRIVPVTLIGNDRVFPSNALMPITPGRGIMKMVVHPPISVEGKTDDELSALTKTAIASALPEEKK